MHLRRGSGGRFKPRFSAPNLPLFCPSVARSAADLPSLCPWFSSRKCVLRTKDDVNISLAIDVGCSSSGGRAFCVTRVTIGRVLSSGARCPVSVASACHPRYARIMR